MTRGDNHWTTGLFHAMDTLDIGWTHQIRGKLKEYGLEEDIWKIKSKSRPSWKKEVEIAAEKINQEKMKEDCLEENNGDKKNKTKDGIYNGKTQWKRLQTTNNGPNSPVEQKRCKIGNTSKIWYVRVWQKL